MLDRIEHSQAGIGTVARHQDDLDTRTSQAGVKTEQLLDQWERVAGLQGFFLVFDLVFAVSLHTFGQVDLVAVAQVEQRPRRNRQHQLVAQSLCHGVPPNQRLCRSIKLNAW